MSKVVYCWNTEYPHFDNIQTIHEFIRQHLGSKYIVKKIDEQNNMLWFQNKKTSIEYMGKCVNHTSYTHKIAIRTLENE